MKRGLSITWLIIIAILVLVLISLLTFSNVFRSKIGLGPKLSPASGTSGSGCPPKPGFVCKLKEDVACKIIKYDYGTCPDGTKYVNGCHYENAADNSQDKICKGSNRFGNRIACCGGACYVPPENVTWWCVDGTVVSPWPPSPSPT